MSAPIRSFLAASKAFLRSLGRRGGNPQNPDARQARNQFLEKLEALTAEVGAKGSDPRGVPAGIRQRCDQARAHRVANNREYYGNCRCCLACGQRGLFQYGVDDIYIEFDQLICQPREIAVCTTAVFDNDIFTFDIAKVTKPSQEHLR
jgi:hypothetical protein